MLITKAPLTVKYLSCSPLVPILLSLVHTLFLISLVLLEFSVSVPNFEDKDSSCNSFGCLTSPSAGRLQMMHLVELRVLLHLFVEFSFRSTQIPGKIMTLLASLLSRLAEQQLVERVFTEVLWKALDSHRLDFFFLCSNGKNVSNVLSKGVTEVPHCSSRTLGRPESLMLLGFLSVSPAAQQLSSEVLFRRKRLINQREPKC